jgi:hypothetical protein
MANNKLFGRKQPLPVWKKNYLVIFMEPSKTTKKILVEDRL